MTVIEGGKSNGAAAPARPAAPEGLTLKRCSIVACPREAEFVVVLLLRPAGHKGQPMRMRIGVCVCRQCQSPLPDKFITNAEWARLLAEQFDARKIKRPARILTEVDYVPVAEDPNLDGYEG